MYYSMAQVNRSSSYEDLDQRVVCSFPTVYWNKILGDITELPFWSRPVTLKGCLN